MTKKKNSSEFDKNYNYPIICAFFSSFSLFHSMMQIIEHFAFILLIILYYCALKVWMYVLPLIPFMRNKWIFSILLNFSNLFPSKEEKKKKKKGKEI